MSSSSPSSSFVIPDANPSSDDAGASSSSSSSSSDEVDSLPSISSGVLSSVASLSGDDDGSDAQREWEASLEQLQLLVTMVLVPFAGKFLGRKFAYWSASPVSLVEIRC